MIKKIEIIQTKTEYQKKISECKDYRNQYLLIDNGKEIIENYNVHLMPNFHLYRDPYVSEEIKFMQLITDLDVVNQNIIESHQIWDSLMSAEDMNHLVYNTYLYKRINKLHEYIVFDLKHFIDEVIATVSIIKGYVIHDKVFVSSIGAYLNKKQKDYHDFDEFIDLFEKLDNLSNSYKHSYANSDFFAIGKDEDCFVALYSKYNDFGNEPEKYVISINYIVKEFNKFYKFSFKLIDQLTK